MEKKNMDKKIGMAVVIAGIIGLVIGVGIGWMVASAKYKPVKDGNMARGAESQKEKGMVGNGMRGPETTSGEGSALGIGSSMSAPSVASISVSNQAAANTAIVSLVSSDAPAWLAVREYNNGIAGNILGAKRIDLGTTANVAIPLLRPTETGKLYYVVLFKDNGDRVFDFKTDAPMTTNGSLISQTFLAQ